MPGAVQVALSSQISKTETGSSVPHRQRADDIYSNVYLYILWTEPYNILAIFNSGTSGLLYCIDF